MMVETRWNESDHPRESDGKFTDSGGGGGSAGSSGGEAQESGRQPRLKILESQNAYQKERLEAGASFIPKNHAAVLKDVNIKGSKVNAMKPGESGAGLFTTIGGKPFIFVADQIQRPNGRSRLEKDPATVLVHELGHALDEKYGLSSKLAGEFSKDVVNLKGPVKEWSQYFTQSNKEIFAEAYTYVHSSDKVGDHSWFGLSKKRAEQNFPNTITAVRNLKLPT